MGEELTADEARWMAWWNNMTEDERSSALDAAVAAGYADPSVYDAWCVYKAEQGSD